jgi:hypothetical protein
VTETDIKRVETELGVQLPAEYREILLNGTELQALTHVLGGVVYPFFRDTLYLDPDELIDVNTWGRKPESAVEYVFPGWWKENFIIGSNGGGDYYCLRLDDTPDVWFLCCDSGEISHCYSSVTDYVEDALESYRASQRGKRIVYQGTNEDTNPDASTWLNAESPHLLFDHLKRTVTARKLRLFGIECCRRIWTLMTDETCHRAVLLAERMVEASVSPDEVACLLDQLKEQYLTLCERRNPPGPAQVRLWCTGAAKNLLQKDEAYLRNVPIYAGDADLLGVWQSASSVVCHHFAVDLLRGLPGELMTEESAQADLLREILGNVLCPVRFENAWRTSSVIAVARAIYESLAFHDMPILADALSDAGCNETRVLDHCRGKGRHVRGCWVLDAVLDRA